MKTTEQHSYIWKEIRFDGCFHYQYLLAYWTKGGCRLLFIMVEVPCQCLHNVTSCIFYMCVLLKKSKKSREITAVEWFTSNISWSTCDKQRKLTDWCSGFTWLNMNFTYLSFTAYIHNSSSSLTQYYFFLKHFGQLKKCQILKFYFFVLRRLFKSWSCNRLSDCFLMSVIFLNYILPS